MLILFDNHTAYAVVTISIFFVQKLHTLFNLAEVLDQHQSGCSRTLNDDKLQDQVSLILFDYNHC